MPEPASGTQRPRNTAGRILVVDDDEDVREILRLILEAGGHHVVDAGDAAEALDRVEPIARPSLILLDLMLPGMDGEQLLRTFRSNPKLAGVPIVIMSGDVMARRKAELLAADGCLMKPVEIDDLMATVERFVGP